LGQWIHLKVGSGFSWKSLALQVNKLTNKKSTNLYQVFKCILVHAGRCCERCSNW
jgi:hypothetical protein